MYNTDINGAQTPIYVKFGQYVEREKQNLHSELYNPNITRYY
jgi:hypothetical protein